MAPPAERPPSEQGPEYQALDAIAELSRKVDELAQRPAIALPAHSNWWDVLPPPFEGTGSDPGKSFAEILTPAGVIHVGNLPTRFGAWQAAVRAGMYPDRLELSLQLNGGWIVWQRALFYERPMVA